MHEDPQDAAGRLRALLMEFGGVSAAEDQIYALCDAAAVRHVFAVAASLDSQVIGEPQVLGQVKAAHRLSVETGMGGPGLATLLQAAYGPANSVRNGTGIARSNAALAPPRSPSA